MLLFSPALFLLLLPGSAPQELQVRGHRTPRDTRQGSVKLIVSEGCITSSNHGKAGEEVNLVPGSPLVLTHHIKLVPSASGPGPGSGPGSGSCGCEADLAALLERLERLEREVSSLREVCGGGSSEESKGPGCSMKTRKDECLNECSDQGRCEDGSCVCFPGFTGPDCSQSDCPGNCHDRGRCADGRCFCDPGFTGADCSEKSCPGDCGERGRCEDGQCVCVAGFTGSDCSEKACPDDCNNRGRCVNGKCVCKRGFTGADCSVKSCPRNCNSRGRCLNGQCVCGAGFTGLDCSKRSCPENCSDRGRCVNGKCVCDVGFSGHDCSERSCPGNCNGRGRCVSGHCICEDGFTGSDCSEKTCANDCSDRGRCVSGRCICEDGFGGADCAERSCPGNCNNHGKCVNGNCVCEASFTGTDCSEKACPENCNSRGRCVSGRCICEDGFTGSDCSEKTCANDCSDRGRCVSGRCICEDGFTGSDCSEKTCANDCSDRGRCVSGQCICEDGFGGTDCAERSCPGNCDNHGKCVNGNCVCEASFTGADCSEKACPENCNSRGRCVNGECLCDDGFAGSDCSERSCPNDCGDRGRCADGKCICGVGFTGPDCADKACPENCNSRGRCFKGRCVCRRGFTGLDCSLCVEGMTGPNCDIVMSAVSQLTAQNVTETSVTLTWTPPPVRYDTYDITLSSRKEGAELLLTSQVDGGGRSFTQTGLAAGQEYSATIRGTLDGHGGAESSAHFTTLISAPSDLRVVKTTSSSAVVQWEKSQGEIDRYRLTASPRGGRGQSQEMTIPADQSSAHIQQLEAGIVYDIIVVAEKDNSRSGAVETQTVPGKTFPRVFSAPQILQVQLAHGAEGSTIVQELHPTPDVQVTNQEGKDPDTANSGGPGRDSSPSVVVRHKPVVSRTVALNDSRPTTVERLTLAKRPKVPGSFRYNTTRVVSGGRKPGFGSFKKTQIGGKQNVPVLSKKSKVQTPQIGDKTTDVTVEDIGGRHEELDEYPVMLSGTDSEPNHSQEPKEESNAGMAASVQQQNVASPAPSGTDQHQEKKCFNKVKVTHLSRLPKKDRSSECGPDGTVLAGKTLDEAGGTQLSDLKAPPAETDLDYSPDPLHKLLTDTFDRLTVRTFSVHLSKPSNLPVDTDAARKQILTGLKPLISFSSPSLSSSTPEPPDSDSSTLKPSDPDSSSSNLEPSEPDSSSSTLEPSKSFSFTSTPEPSDYDSSSSTHEPSDSDSSTSITTSSNSPLPSFSSPSQSLSSALSLPSSPPSPSSQSPPPLTAPPPYHSHSPSPSMFLPPPSTSTSSAASDSFGSKNAADVVSPAERRNQHSSGRASPPLFRQGTPKRAPIRRPHPNFGRFQNRTNLSMQGPHRLPPRLNISPKEDSETRLALANEGSKELALVKVDAPNRAPSPESSGLNPNQKTMQTERRQIPPRRPLPKDGYMRRPFPNAGSPLNRTRPNWRSLTRPSPPLHLDTQLLKERISPTEVPTTSPVIRESFSSEGKEGVREGDGDPMVRITSTVLSDELNQTIGRSREPLSHRPTNIVRYFRRPLQNGSSLHMRRLQYPNRGLVRKPLPKRKPIEGTSTYDRSQLSLQEEKAVPVPQTSPPKPLLTTVRPQSTVKPQTDPLGKVHSGLIQIIEPGGEDTRSTVFSKRSEIHIQRDDVDQNSVPADPHRPNIGKTASDPRSSRPEHRPLPVTNPNEGTGTYIRKQPLQQEKEGSPSQTGEQGFPRSYHAPPPQPSSPQRIPVTTLRPQTKQQNILLENVELGRIRTTEPEGEESSSTVSSVDSGVHIRRDDADENTMVVVPHRPTVQQTASHPRSPMTEHRPLTITNPKEGTGTYVRRQPLQQEKEGSPSQTGERGFPRSYHAVPSQPSSPQGIPVTTVRPQTKQQNNLLEKVKHGLIQTTEPEGEESSSTVSSVDSEVHIGRDDADENTMVVVPHRPTVQQTASHPGSPMTEHRPLTIANPKEGTGTYVRSQPSQQEKESFPERRQSGEHSAPASNQGVPIPPTSPQVTLVTTVGPPSKPQDDHGPIQTNTSAGKEALTTLSGEDSNVHQPVDDDGANTSHITQNLPTNVHLSSGPKSARPVSIPKRQTPLRSPSGLHRTQIKKYIKGSQRGQDPKTDESHSMTGKTRSPAFRLLKESGRSSTGVTRGHWHSRNVGMTNQTSGGHALTRNSPEGKSKNVVTRTETRTVIRTEIGDDQRPNEEEHVKDQVIHSGRQSVPGSNQGEIPHMVFTTVGPQATISSQGDPSKGGEHVPVQTGASEKEINTTVSMEDSKVLKQKDGAGKTKVPVIQQRSNIQQKASDLRTSRPGSLPKRQLISRGSPGGRHTQTKKYVSEIQKGPGPETNGSLNKTGNTRRASSKPLKESDGSSGGVTREHLDYVGITNQTSGGLGESPEGTYKNVESSDYQSPRPEEHPNGQESQDKNQQAANEELELESGNETPEDDNSVPDSNVTKQPDPTSQPGTELDKTFRDVPPGTARHLNDRRPQTNYAVTFLGKGSGLLSGLDRLVISTGPEAPTNVLFSDLTDSSVTVSWTKPRSRVSGFKVTYTNALDGEPVSVSLDSQNSSVVLSQLSPGSSYEVDVVSVLGLDESDPVNDIIATRPDPPTNLQAVNVTDRGALLLWRPALAAIDGYAIIYGTGPGSELRVTVSGNNAEHQLIDLEGSSTYSVTISSHKGGANSSAANTSFTTTPGSDGAPQNLRASELSPRTALLSWKPPPHLPENYRLTYQSQEQEIQEVRLNSSVSEVQLSGLYPGSRYRVQLQAQSGGSYGATISTEFTTVSLRYPFPRDCSQELLNGIRTSGVVEIFPEGRTGSAMTVYCDMETDGGGWTVFQRRRDGSVNFFRGWRDYVRGFGDQSGEFWLGLESLHQLTATVRMSLRVDLRDGGESAFAKYSTFEVGKNNYRLTVGGYSGTAGDSLSYHNNRIFSTRDRDPSPFITRCAMSYRGGWWYRNCHEANLNGLYGTDVRHQGLIWKSWKGKDFSIAFTEMKIRPSSFTAPPLHTD